MQASDDHATLGNIGTRCDAQSEPHIREPRSVEQQGLLGTQSRGVHRHQDAKKGP